jgi:hypothetical protein
MKVHEHKHMDGWIVAVPKLILSYDNVCAYMCVHVHGFVS